MENSFYLRPYEETDESTIFANSEALYYDKFNEFSKNTIRITIVNGNIVGWLHLTIPQSSLYSGFLFIYVFPEYRRKGIGTRIYREAEALLNPVECNWWSSYPESEAADRFVMSVGFDYTNTNSYMVHNGKEIPASTEGIRPGRLDDYPQAPDIWSHEYANMHIRIGMPYEKHQLNEEERKAEYNQFVMDLKNSFVMEEGGKIIGYGTLFDNNSGIDSVAVDRAFSGHGYGTRLAAFLTNECISRGNSSPCLYCESGNSDAMHIYQKLGYVEVSRETVTIKNQKR